MTTTNEWLVRTIFEDEDLLAVSKPAGISVHGSHSASTEVTLESLVAEMQQRRLILLHRIDKGTSGIVLFAKRKAAAGEMSRAFEEKRIRKAYVAVVEGEWDRRATKVESYIHRDVNGQMQSTQAEPGKKSITTVRVLLKSPKGTLPQRTLIEAMPKTGRTHQIRLHCAGVGHAVVGDARYGPSNDRSDGSVGFALHAYRVDFQHPVTKARVKLIDPPGESWRQWLSGFSEVELALWKKKLEQRV